MKIVINRSYSSFYLSPQAIARYAELQGKKIYFFLGNGTTQHSLTAEEASYYHNFLACYTPEFPESVDTKTWLEMSEVEKHRYLENLSKSFFSIFDLKRTDPLLIQVVEELGPKVNYQNGRLCVVEVPDETDFTIFDYDGMEVVVEVGHFWPSNN